MHSYLMETICRIGIFIICAQVLIHFRPNASYEKYFKMLASAMILVQLFAPLGNLLGAGDEQNLIQRVERFEEELSKRLEEAGQDWQAFAQEREGTVERETVSEEVSQGDPISIAPIENEAIKVQIQSGEGGGQDAANRRSAGE